MATNPAEPAYWCVNFDVDDQVLDHGVSESLWLMQYQYSHGGHAYQGEKNQIATTSRTWNIVREIKPGDWLVAYLPNNMFFAVGRVIEPRFRERHTGQPQHQDTIDRTVHEHEHSYLNGVVRYTDASAFYEDFTDPWNRSVTNSSSQQPEAWRYPQRVDVQQWQFIVRSGVQMEGLAKSVPFPRYRDAAFQIPQPFFEQIKSQLQGVSVTAEYRSADEVENETVFKEGAAKQVTVNAYERNPEARKACIAHYGTGCTVCGFNFGKVYGELGEGFVHVHHLRDLATIGEEYEVNPIDDLRPVCPNCHAMLHRKVPAMTIEELKGIIRA
jgi:hypothetical protein